MILHYIRFFLRNMLRKKGFTIINILGLSVGMAISILILIYVFYEMSFDKFIENADNKYKIYSHLTFSGETHIIDRSCGALASKSINEIPEVKTAVSIYDAFPFLRYKDKLIHENMGDIYFATPGVLDFFSIDLIKGNKNKVLSEPFSMLLSESMARKYFEDDNPIGKVLTYNDRYDFKITGVIRDYPGNSHLKFSAIMPMEALLKIQGIPDLSMLGNSCLTYIELIENGDIAAVNAKLVEASYSFIPPALIEQLQVSFDHSLQKVSGIHLYGAISDFDDTETLRRITYVYIFTAIAILILLLACINFMNLSTARYANRAREVSMRKIIGAERSVIIKQFMGESLFYTFISLITAVVLAELLMPKFNELLGLQISLAYFKKPATLLVLLGLGLIVGVISGSYPAFFLSSFKPLSVMQGKLKTAATGKLFRWGLVVFQFVIAIALISSTMVIYSQMKYVKDKDLGFKIDELLVIHLRSSEIIKNLTVFQNKLDALAGVENFSLSTDKPGVDATWYGAYKFGVNDSREHPAFAMIDIDENFIESIGLELIEGRNFEPTMKSDTGAVIINQAMQRYAGWDNPIGKAVYELTEDMGRRKYTVIGVLKDFHMESLHENIQPMLFKFKERYRYCIARINPEKRKETIAAIEAIWDDLSPSRPFYYQYLSDSYDASYSSERQFARIFLYFTLFAIFIACLGIIGLVSFITLSRTREIGIRKVLGSSSNEIVVLITSDFMKMLLVSFILACPLAWFFMNKWLERFAYKIDLNIGIFLFAGLLTLVITLLSVGYHALIASHKNPVDAIRYE